MTSKDISTIRRFMGVVEGVAVSLPDQAQSLLYDHMYIVEDILRQEEKKEMTEGHDDHT